MTDHNTFTLQIHLINDALTGAGADDHEANQELARILRHAADLVSEGRLASILRDINGNTVGRFSL